MLTQFEEAASEFIEEVGAVKALSMALAHISGQTKKVKARSLISGEEGLVTLELKTDTEVRNPSFVTILLGKIVSPRITDNLKNIKILKELNGVVFDINERDAKTISEAYKAARIKTSITFSIDEISELPPLKEQRNDFGFRRNNNNRGGYNRGNNRGGKGGHGYRSGSGGREQSNFQKHNTDFVPRGRGRGRGGRGGFSDTRSWYGNSTRSKGTFNKMDSSRDNDLENDQSSGQPKP